MIRDHWTLAALRSLGRRVSAGKWCPAGWGEAPTTRWSHPRHPRQRTCQDTDRDRVGERREEHPSSWAPDTCGSLWAPLRVAAEPPWDAPCLQSHQSVNNTEHPSPPGRFESEISNIDTGPLLGQCNHDYKDRRFSGRVCLCAIKQTSNKIAAKYFTQRQSMIMLQLY